MEYRVFISQPMTGRTLDEVKKERQDIETIMHELNDGLSTKGMSVTVIDSFDEQAFIERYCPMEGGNDYLGWIDDIHKLLDGEAEPGDAASTGDYADMDADELHKELKRLTAIVLHRAVDRYIKENY